MQSPYIKVTVLGSGTCVPRPDRASPGFYLEVGKTKILLDCGSGIVRQLVRADKDYRDIDLIIISHLHADHTSDLAAFFNALNYTPDFDRKKDILVLGGRGFKEFFGRLVRAFPHIQPRPNTYKIEVFECKKVDKLPDFTLETIQGNHDSSSILIKLKAFKKSIVYTGDTGYDPTIVTLAKESDLLISECSYPEERKVKDHLTPRLAGKIAENADVKTLLLTHFYPQIDKTDIKTQVKKYFSGQVIIAQDLLELKI